jgi:hypothetical protein
VDDVRYIGTLEIWIRRAGLWGKDDAKALARDAQVFLAGLKSKDPARLDLDAVRRNISTRIVGLKERLQRHQ